MNPFPIVILLIGSACINALIIMLLWYEINGNSTNNQNTYDKVLKLDTRVWRLEDPEKVRLTLLAEPEEIELTKKMSLYPDAVQEAADTLEPHRLVSYVEELAALFHQFYTKYRVINDNRELTLARLCLIGAVKIVIEDTLALLGISAPRMM